MGRMVFDNETATSTSGWTASPNGRGTFDIIISCLFTIFLCCWTSVCPNLPALSDGKWTQFRDKFDLACIGLLGPEFLMGIAIAQRNSARRSVKQFNDKGFHDWTLTHAFFADMGGFVLEASDLREPIPLDAEQLFYLVKHKYVEYPTWGKEYIDDKNKADGLARLLAIGQALWFVVSSIARLIQGLSMTTLELTTLSFILVMLPTSYCWFYKPSDVSRPVILQCKTSLAQIRSEAGLQDPDDYRRTPLDFVTRDDFVIDLIWGFYVRLLHSMHIPLFSRPIKGRPHNRNRGDRFLRTDLDFEVFAGVFILLFCATFTCAWNFYFPTEAERMLWRCASIYTLAFGILGGAYTWTWHLSLLDKHKTSHRPAANLDMNLEDLRQRKGIWYRFTSLASTWTNISQNNTQIPISLLFPVTILCMFYSLFRGFTLIEDIIGLRSLPLSAYSTVDWSQYIPHI